MLVHPWAQVPPMRQSWPLGRGPTKLAQHQDAEYDANKACSRLRRSRNWSQMDSRTSQSDQPIGFVKKVFEAIGIRGIDVLTHSCQLSIIQDVLLGKVIWCFEYFVLRRNHIDSIFFRLYIRFSQIVLICGRPLNV